MSTSDEFWLRLERKNNRSSLPYLHESMKTPIFQYCKLTLTASSQINRLERTEKNWHGKNDSQHFFTSFDLINTIKNKKYLI